MEEDTEEFEDLLKYLGQESIEKSDTTQEINYSSIQKSATTATASTETCQ